MSEALTRADPGVGRGSEDRARMRSRPEAELLLTCATHSGESERASRIAALIRTPIDWEWLLRRAHQHGLLPLVASRLAEVGLDAVAEPWRGAIREECQKSLRRDKILTEELGKILEMFTMYGVPALVTGEAAVAALFEGSLSGTHVNYLKLFVEKDDVFVNAQDLLAALDYQPRYPVSAPQQAAFLQFQDEYRFTHVKNGVQVALQWAITPKHFAPLRGLEELWNRRARAHLDGTEITTLPPEELLLSLCLEGGASLFTHAGTIREIGRLIRSQEKMDWSHLLRRARSIGSERILLLGAALAQDLLGTPLPKAFAQRLESDRVIPRLAREAREWLVRDSRPPAGSGERARFILRTRERLRDRARYCLSQLLTPTKGDLAPLALRPSLSFLYYLWRPVRLAGSHGFGLFESRILAPQVPTSTLVLDRMLELGEVGPGDVLYDLGCGDGRIVIAAAKRFGIRGVGVEIDRDRLLDATMNARNEGVEDLVTFVHGDATSVDVSPATVVMLFLSATSNMKLRDLLQRVLQPGARIVSHYWDMGDWAPRNTEMVMDGDDPTPIYLWRIEDRSNSLGG